jgi:shikimate dehydrogenase
MVLGAGGSARAAVWGLLDAGAAQVSVWNRTPERARALAGELGAHAVPRPVDADLLVNCTSVGLQRSATEIEALNQLDLSADQVGGYAYVIDLVYRDGPTPLLASARRSGAATVDGLEMLVAQGALSFQRWTGAPAPLAAMRRGAGLEEHARAT